MNTDPDKLHLLHGSSTIIVADSDNLSISFKHAYGNRLDESALFTYFAAAARRTVGSAVLTTNKGYAQTTKAWKRGGWKVVSIVREIIHNCRGTEKIANADLEICFETAAMLARHHHADTLLIASGDGTLATSIARQARRLRPSLRILSAGIPQHSSARLRKRKDFAAFLPIGPELARA